MEFSSAVLDCAKELIGEEGVEIIGIGDFNQEGFSVLTQDRDVFSPLFQQKRTIHISWETFISSLPNYDRIEYL